LPSHSPLVEQAFAPRSLQTPADQGRRAHVRHCPGELASCSFGRVPYSCSRSKRRPRSAPIHIRWNPDKVDRFPKTTNSRRCGFAGCIDNRARSRCWLCSSARRRHCYRDRVSNLRVCGSWTGTFARRRFAVCSRPTPNKMTNRTPCLGIEGTGTKTVAQAIAAAGGAIGAIARWVGETGREVRADAKRSCLVARLTRVVATRCCSTRRARSAARAHAEGRDAVIATLADSGRWDSCHTCQPRTAAQPRTGMLVQV